MSLTYLRTSIFDSPAQTLVNTVNTVGVMGKGIAKEFKSRYPDMYSEYRRLCDGGRLRIGSLHLWRGSDPWVLNFPTKWTWRKPSEIEYVEQGLESFRRNYEKMGIASISFPPLGCGNGNLDWDEVRPLMERYLRTLPIPIYIHDRQVTPDFVPEHGETRAREAPATFTEFLADITACVAISRGKFKTLRDRTPFFAEFLSDNSVQIRRDNGKVERLVLREELESAWTMLQTGLLTADQYSDESSRRYKSYIFSILAELPYIRLAEVQRARAGNRPLGHGLFVQKASSKDSHQIVPDQRQEELCLSP